MPDFMEFEEHISLAARRPQVPQLTMDIGRHYRDSRQLSCGGILAHLTHSFTTDSPPWANLTKYTIFAVLHPWSCVVSGWVLLSGVISGWLRSGVVSGWVLHRFVSGRNMLQSPDFVIHLDLTYRSRLLYIFRFPNRTVGQQSIVHWHVLSCPTPAEI